MRKPPSCDEGNLYLTKYTIYELDGQIHLFIKQTDFENIGESVANQDH